MTKRQKAFKEKDIKTVLKYNLRAMKIGKDRVVKNNHFHYCIKRKNNHQYYFTDFNNQEEQTLTMYELIDLLVGMYQNKQFVHEKEVL